MAREIMGRQLASLIPVYLQPPRHPVFKNSKTRSANVQSKMHLK